jgi:hypothetical protein
VLDPVPELTEHHVRDVERVLADEVDADPLRPDQTDDLLNFFLQRHRRIAKEQVRLVEKEDQLRLLDIPYLRQRLKQLRQQPEQEGRVDDRRPHQPIRRQDVDRPATVLIDPDEVGQNQSRFAKEEVPARLFECQQTPLDRADTRRRDVAVRGRDRLPVVTDVLEQRPQILQIEQQQPVVVRVPERDLEYPTLRVVEVE